MNKTEMAKKLAKKADLSQAKAAEVVDIIFSSESGHGIIAVELDAAPKRVNWIPRPTLSNSFTSSVSSSSRKVLETAG